MFSSVGGCAAGAVLIRGEREQTSPPCKLVEAKRRGHVLMVITLLLPMLGRKMRRGQMLDQAPYLSRHKVIPAPYQIVMLIHDGIPHGAAAHSCLVVSAVADFSPR